MKRVNITTKDNPFNPFDNFVEWFLYDTEKGYFTSSKIARLTKQKEYMTEEEESKALEEAIDRLIEIDPLDIYIKLERDDDKGEG